MIFGSFDKCRRDVLAGYARQPEIVLVMDELPWIADRGEQVLGVVFGDRIDDDFGRVALCQAPKAEFRVVLQTIKPSN